MKPSTTTDGKDSLETNVDLHDVTLPNDTKQLGQTSSPPAASAAAQQSIGSTQRLLASINDLLKTKLHTDARLRHQTDKNQQMMNEWVIAAAVIDRFCFVIFVITLAAGSFVFFLLLLARP